jgi:hypothetical protein
MENIISQTVSLLDTTRHATLKIEQILLGLLHFMFEEESLECVMQSEYLMQEGGCHITGGRICSLQLLEGEVRY